MSPSFDLPDVDVLTTGTIGPPGARVFYLQARAGSEVVSLRLEKGQVAALAEYLAERLADLRAPDPADVPADLDLQEPVTAEWIVGSLAVSYDEDLDRVMIVAEEIQLVEDDDDEGVDPAGEPPSAGAIARFGLSRSQVAAFVRRAAAVVSAGRPPCPLCGRPLNPEGHVCVKANGHSA